MLFAQALRGWFEAASPQDTQALGALADVRIRRVLTQVHQAPAQNWTVDRMAQVAAMSRSAFADRFGQLLGVPPARYVRAFRLRTAAFLLGRPDTTVGEVAHRIGYSEEAFCRRFKQHFRQTPGQWRAGETVNALGDPAASARAV